MVNRSLILPGDPEFDLTLATPPPGWRNVIQGQDSYAFVARSDSGLLEPVGMRELEEYLEGGEYDERLDNANLKDEWE